MKLEVKKNKNGQNTFQIRTLSLRKKYDVLTIKGGSRRAEKRRRVLMMMMMKAAKLGWAGPGQKQKYSLVISRNVQDRSLQGARQEYGRGGAESGAGEQQRERERERR